MEDRPAPEQPLAERPYQRPPALDAAMGVSLFLLVFMVFASVQVAVFVKGVMDRVPAYQDRPFSLSVLQEEPFQQEYARYANHGDITAQAAIWSSLVGILLIVGITVVWRGVKGMRDMLALRSASWLMVGKWSLFFLLFSLALDGISYLAPALQSDFMDKLLETTTNMALLVLGMGLLGPIYEELLLRGLLFGSLRKVADTHVAVAITAGLFTLMHVQYSWQVLLILVLPMGVVLGYARANGKSLWVSIVPHMLNNLLSLALAQWL